MAQGSQNAKGSRHRNHGYYHKEYGNPLGRAEFTQETEKMSKKHALDVTTKGWSKEQLASLREKVNNLNFRWEAKVLDKRGKIKWFHAYTKADVEIFAIQEGYKILQVTRKT